MNFIIPLVILPYDIMVSAGQTDEELDSDLKAVETDLAEHCKFDGANNNALFMWNAERRIGVIRIREIPETYVMHGSLAHEIFHAVEFALGEAGIKHSRDSSEAFAYHIGFLTREIYERSYNFSK